MFESGSAAGAAGLDTLLSRGQRALWFLQRLAPLSPAYNSVHLVRLGQATDLDALRRAMDGLVERHEALRTSFPAVDGRPARRVAPSGAMPFAVEDAGGAGLGALREQIARDVYAPFELAAGPLARCRVYRNSAAGDLVLMAIHHAVVDLWSWALFLHDLGALYAAARAGVAPALAPPLYGWADHVRAEEALLASADGERLWASWQRALAGCDLAPVALPLDRARPASPSFRGGSRGRRLGLELSRRFRALGRAHGATPFMTLLAAFAVLLHRYTGQEDLLVGTPAANRTRENAGLFGYVVNLLPMRVDLSGAPSFATLLGRVRDTVRRGLEAARFPHALVVERLHPARGAGGAPLVNVALTYQKTAQLVDAAALASFALGEEGGRLELGGLALGSLPLHEQPSPFDLTAIVAEAGEELVLSLEYQRDLFDEASIDSMLAQFATLLDGIVEDPARAIADLPLATGGERRALLAAALPPEPGPAPEPVHEAFARQVAATPEAVAVEQGEVALTYAELARRAARLSRRLRGMGVAPEAPVGVLVERSPELVTALWGVLGAGAAWLPLDPAAPDARNAFILEDAGAGVVLTTRDRAVRLAGLGAAVVVLDDVDVDASEAAGPAAPAPVGPDSLAYVIYTSGTTGRPKGVLVDHEAFATHCREVVRHYQLDPADRVLQFASPAFDASLEQIVPPLLAGATVVLRDDDVPGGGPFHRFAARARLSVVNVPPAWWAEWARACAGAAAPEPVPALRLVIVGGDAMPGEPLAAWRRSPMAGARLLNAYGPTEATITATLHEVALPSEGEAAPATLPIGRPLPGRSAYVVERGGELAPDGVPGELLLGGRCIARGYLRRPDLTEARFTADPFDHRAGARAYRTGDLVRRRHDGAIEFLGRVDGQVKLRGFRIELGEIEALLAEHPAVREAAVDLVQAGPADRRLAAWVALAPGVEAGPSELKRHLRARLPEYMVPAAFAFVAALPRTAGGKLDRTALPALAAGAVDRAPFVAPRDEVEAGLATLWAELLGLERVGAQDDFFDLGGHSLLAAQLVARVQRAFGVELPLRTVFEARTVEALALAVLDGLAARIAPEELDEVLDRVEAGEAAPPAAEPAGG
ncbi:non-ribosomal peptide synthetase [Anaeromyxobacter diazotrophicus]|uniref:Pyoverdine sidechain peptide synthetase n=1 Tax=Anaeromyxobacter diazotrophicus TaxID=2590199 RepID=A0A7I9VP86_9BACT|nr:amino acid adenylation domain-containing protein [Anaeromyxobacter diazotrophicus]GEJ57767.1 pyoverdine sidechain peptide synthetase [Anaeromyxobacter diazotrophicus]